MPFVFANPAGFWALLGIPAILLIHFLQRQSQPLSISTLFLLENIDRRSLKGRKIDRLRNSLPLWLQLLCVLLLTWLLTEPRWLRGNVVHPIVFVLDSSASMEAFREEAAEAIGESVANFSKSSGEIALTLMESHAVGETLFSSDSASGLDAALAAWRPAAGAHSPEEALRVGRSVAGADGTLVYVTDHTEPSPGFGAKFLSVGEAIENVGFAGSTVDSSDEEALWRASVRNYSSESQTRDWFAATDGQRTSARAITLAAGETRTLSGAFPEGTDRIQLALAPDRFSRDDTLFLVIPKPKPIVTASTVAPGIAELTSEIVDSLENAPEAESGDTLDLVFTSYNPLQPQDLPSVAVVFLDQEAVPKEFFGGSVVASNHPLTEDLAWQGLIARSTPSIPADDRDTTIVWQGDRPLVILRETPAVQQLIFNFDIAHSNASRLPAFIVVIHRFVDRIRDRKIAPVAANTELRQSLSLAFDASGEAPPLEISTDSGSRTIPLERARFLRAPDSPGFFRVGQGEQLLIDAAANFADTREADFSDAAAYSDIGDLPTAAVRKRTRPDPYWQIWLVGTVAVLLFSWWVLQRRETRPTPASQT